MRHVLPGGATLGGDSQGGNERLVACRPRAAVLERTRLRPPLPIAGGDLAENGEATVLERTRLLPQPDPTPTGDGKTTTVKPVPGWLRDNFEKVVLPVIIAVLSAIILAWLGLNK
jgi:hypothetical protein